MEIISNLYSKVVSELKNPDILERKPNLKICSNHRIEKVGRVNRYWNSQDLGPAKKAGNWYKEK